MTLSPETTFELLWNELGGPPLEREVRFHPTRRWRADFAVGKVLLEVEGGVWSGGRHVRGKGYTLDIIKYNVAQLIGYDVYRFTPDMITPEHVQPVIDFLKGKVGA